MPSTSEKPTSRLFALGQHTADFESLLEAVPDALVGVDRDGVIRCINRHAESLFGYDRDDLVGQPIETLVPESSRPGHPAHRERYFAGPRTRRPGLDREATTDQKPVVSPACLHGRRRDGTVFPLNLSLSRIDTDDGLLVIGAVRDMTDRESASKKGDRMSRMAAIARFSGDAIISVGPDGIITSWNPAAERMYGYSCDEMVGRSGWFMAPDRAPR
jgi:PAS domain S-box-containing protein